MSVRIIALRGVSCVPSTPDEVAYNLRWDARIVDEKQQLMKPSSPGVVSKPGDPGGAVPAPCVIMGLNRSTHDVKIAFCVESKATLPYKRIYSHSSLNVK